MDDILVTGASEQEHLRNVDDVLMRFETAGMRRKKEKCVFLLLEVEYLVHKISAQGLQSTDEKVRAIANAPAPQNVSQLKSFLGLVNYYAKFLPNLLTVLAPLHQLLQKKSRLSWGKVQRKAFEEAKAQLTSPCLLVHFDGQK